MDKSWIQQPKGSHEYVVGVSAFLDFAFEHKAIRGKILCPCEHCKFLKSGTRDECFEHLLLTHFPRNYTFWDSHGEVVTSSNVEQVASGSHLRRETASPAGDSIREMVYDAFRWGMNSQEMTESVVDGDAGVSNTDRESSGGNVREFYDLLKDNEHPLYDGCTKFSKLSFLIKLYHIKCLCGVSDKAMDMVFKLLHDAFSFANIPPSNYDAKKIINKLGLKYEKIHACPNDCMLYWGPDADRENCKECEVSRWKKNSKKKKQPIKVLRYFPLKSRLQRLFMSSKTAETMRWHVSEPTVDDMMRHPRDSEAWKHFESMHTEFASEKRNVRLALATDGFNPFGNLSTSYSIWPVILIPYNSPPWMCMKSTEFIVSMLIPGKKMPGNNIDIYLQPLIAELKELWENRVETYDAYKNEVFVLKAALLWTISDFPGLGNISGWNTHTGYACPSCNFDQIPLYLGCSRKWCFMGHRRFLRQGHKFRLNRLRFDGHIEDRDPPTLLSGFEILNQTENMEFSFGKRSSTSSTTESRTRKRANVDQASKQWKKRSIFFQLPYWESNLLRHNLDVMHIEKNVCDNVLFTLINDKGKRKDHLEARKDLQKLGIKKELWPKEDGKSCPAALFTMKRQEIDTFLETLKCVIVPDSYSSDFSRCIDLVQRRVFGLKSHDSHILMQELLPLAIRNILPRSVSSVLVDLGYFFKQLCSKVVNPAELSKHQERIALTLCHMEMLFPPSFFTVMVHLTIHLIDEVRLGGPVHYRWMYPMERFLGKLKQFVRNKAQPEGSIAEGWLSEECMTFCSRYLEDDIETRFNRKQRVDDDPMLPEASLSMFPPLGKPVGDGTLARLSDIELLQAHRHILINCPQVEDFISRFRRNMTTKMRNRKRNVSSNEIEKEVHRNVVQAFKIYINDNPRDQTSKELLALAQGPLRQARKFTAYNVNGFKFRTIDLEKNLKTQNSGVFCNFGTKSYASTRDNRPREGTVPYYGKLVDIFKLNYHDIFHVTVFKCAWANTMNQRFIRVDDFGFTSVNFSHLIHSGDHEDDEPFIQAAEAQLVFYVEDKADKGWSIPIHVKPRDLYDMGEEDASSTYDNEINQAQISDAVFPYDDSLFVARADVTAEFELG